MSTDPQTFGYRVEPIPPGTVSLPPMKHVDQGISLTEEKYSQAVEQGLFEAPGVQFLATYRASTGLYEIRARDGIMRFERLKTPDGRVIFRIDSIEGKIPISNTDGTIANTLAEEVRLAGGPFKPVTAENTSYPDILRRISQLFDSPKSPDMVYIPWSKADPNHPGTGSHGIPDITQSRAPLFMSGPGIRAGGEAVDKLVKVEDIAPTIAQFLGIKPILGRNSAGVPTMQFLKWQDGHSVASSIADARAGAEPYGTAERAVVFVLDGANHQVLMDELEKGNLPNIKRLYDRGVRFKYGHLAEYPTVTYANHTSITTGASPGHTGVPNNSWFERLTQKEQLITDGSQFNAFRTGRHGDSQSETLYEAVARSFPGSDTVALNEPSGRGSTVGTLEMTGYSKILRHGFGIIKNMMWGKKHVTDPVYGKEKEWKKTSTQDNLGVAIGRAMMGTKNPPKLSVFELSISDTFGHYDGPQSERSRAAMQECDRQIGALLSDMDKKGLTEKTMFVLTADHGMEHQSLNKNELGGWKEALKRLSDNGVKTVESTRFVYIKNVLLKLMGPQPRVGVSSQLAVQVFNDDTDKNGNHFPIANAKVKFTDASGNVISTITDANGIARLQISPGAAGAAQVEVVHPDFTVERQQVVVAP